MVKSKTHNGRGARRSGAKGGKSFARTQPTPALSDRGERWGVHIVDPLKKPKTASVEKIRKAMRSYYK
jgi:hypothetical protein